jgi:hypothetical protein
MTPEEEQKKRMEEEIASSTPDRVLFRDVKKFVTSTRIYIAQGFFALRLNMGTEQESFAMSPHTAKYLAHFLSSQVEAYERSFGLIQIDLRIPSPVQMSDLNKPDSGGSAPSPEEPPKPDKPKGKK